MVGAAFVLLAMKVCPVAVAVAAKGMSGIVAFDSNNRSIRIASA